MSNYITYLQSVMTIGILNTTENTSEAERLALLKLHDHDDLNYCYFDQTDFQPVGTELWESPLKRFESDEEGMKFIFSPTDEIKIVIASRLQKPVEDLTDDDLASFIKESLNLSIEKMSN